MMPRTEICWIQAIPHYELNTLYGRHHLGRASKGRARADSTQAYDNVNAFNYKKQML